jgi:hypothetical protein
MPLRSSPLHKGGTLPLSFPKLYSENNQQKSRWKFKFTSTLFCQKMESETRSLPKNIMAKFCGKSLFGKVVTKKL